MAVNQLPLTVIIPIRSMSEEMDERALRSVARQEVPIQELVVVDDGSTPPLSLEWIRSILPVEPPRVALVRNRGTPGPSGARNTGANEAHGSHLVFLDADDELRADWYPAVSGLLDEGRLEFVSYGATVHTTGSRRSPVTKRPSQLGPVFGSISGNFLAGSYVISQSAFEAIGGFDEGVAFGEHHELAMRLGPYLQTRRLAWRVIPNELVDIHTDRSRQRVLSYAPAVLRSTMYVVEKHKLAFEKDAELLARYLGVAGIAAVRVGEHQLSRMLLSQSARVSPNPKRYLRLLLARIAPWLWTIR